MQNQQKTKYFKQSSHNGHLQLFIIFQEKRDPVTFKFCSICGNKLLSQPSRIKKHLKDQHQIEFKKEDKNSCLQYFLKFDQNPEKCKYINWNQFREEPEKNELIINKRISLKRYKKRFQKQQDNYLHNNQENLQKYQPQELQFDQNKSNHCNDFLYQKYFINQIKKEEDQYFKNQSDDTEKLQDENEIQTESTKEINNQKEFQNIKQENIYLKERIKFFESIDLEQSIEYRQQEKEKIYKEFENDIKELKEQIQCQKFFIDHYKFMQQHYKEGKQYYVKECKKNNDLNIEKLFEQKQYLENNVFKVKNEIKLMKLKYKRYDIDCSSDDEDQNIEQDDEIQRIDQEKLQQNYPNNV